LGSSTSVAIAVSPSNLLSPGYCKAVAVQSVRSDNRYGDQ
jgi:hypothetical protein